MLTPWIAHAIPTPRDGEVAAAARFLVGAPLAALPGMVNQLVNARTRYVSDAEQYGLKDYWASPAETLRNRAGDCEDFAGAKYYLLLELGYPADRIWLGYGALRALGDAGLGESQAHMVLLVDDEGSPAGASNPLVLDWSNSSLPRLRERLDFDLQARVALGRRPMVMPVARLSLAAVSELHRRATDLSQRMAGQTLAGAPGEAQRDALLSARP